MEARGVLLCAGGVIPVDGGGGKGAMPTFAAAAAAADAYFSVSPGGLVGAGAGFIKLPFVEPFAIFDIGLCNVANVGSGLFSCIEGRLAAATAGSADFGLGMLAA